MEDKYLKIANYLNKMANEKRINLVDISACAMTLSQRLPLGDIEPFLEEAGVKLVFQPISTYDSNKHLSASHLFRVKSRITNKMNNIILIEENLDRKPQRFISAKVFALYLINLNNLRFCLNYKIMQLIPGSIQDIIASAFARFLYMPFTSVIEELSIYTANATDIPSKESEWLDYISVIAGVNYEIAAIGFNNIRVASCQLRDGLYDKYNFMQQKDEMLNVLEKNSCLIID